MCVKIFTAGRAIPSDDTILSFKRAVQRFLRDNADNGELLLKQVCFSVLNMSQTVIFKAFPLFLERIPHFSTSHCSLTGMLFQTIVQLMTDHKLVSAFYQCHVKQLAQ